jgi:hypothetical protein
LHRKKTEHNMPITTLKVLASVLQLHGPGATIQSDHQGIDAVLNDLRAQDAQATEVYFRRGFVRGGGGYGGFRRGGYHPGFRRGGFLRY